MLTIIRVGALDGIRLNVELSNGNMILFDMQPFMRDPQYAALIEENRILFPKTDGSRIFWRDGPSITIDDLLEQVQKP